MLGHIFQGMAIGLVCNYYKKTYAPNSASHRASNLHKYSMSCIKNPYRVTYKKQKKIHHRKKSKGNPNSVSMKLVEFNQERTHLALAIMLIMDELPFEIVENEGFKQFMDEVQPTYNIHSRVSCHYC